MKNIVRKVMKHEMGMVNVQATGKGWEGANGLDDTEEILVHNHHYHPGHNEPKGERTIENLIKHWDGQKVWAQLEDGMWRQATVIAAVPAEDPKEAWHFVLGSKHDVWRHLISSFPLDDSDLEFGNLHVTDHIDVPEHPIHQLKPHEPFELLPENSPEMKLDNHRCPIHPYVHAYIMRLREMVSTVIKGKGLEELQKKLKAKDNLIRKLKSILKNKYGEDVPDDEDVQFGSGDGNWIGSSGAGVGNASATKAGGAGGAGSASANTNAYGRLRILLQNSQLGENETFTLDGRRLTFTEMIEQIIRKAEEYDGMIKLIEDFKTAINNLNNENNDLEEDNRRLNDRLLALEEALRRTVAEDNEASNQQALRHAKEIAQLNNTIAELRMNLKNGSKAREVLTSDTVTLLPSLGASEEKTVFDDPNEIVFMKNLLFEFRSIDLKAIFAEIRQLSEQVSQMEYNEIKVNREPKVVSWQASSSPNPNNPYLSNGLSQNERALLKDRIRLAAELKEELGNIRHRVKQLEKNRGIKVSSPYDTTTTQTDMFSALTPYVMVSRSELSKYKELEMENERLRAIVKPDMDPEISQREINKLQNEVKELKERTEAVADTIKNYNAREKRSNSVGVSLF